MFTSFFAVRKQLQVIVLPRVGEMITAKVNKPIHKLIKRGIFSRFYLVLISPYTQL